MITVRTQGNEIISKPEPDYLNRLFCNELFYGVMETDFCETNWPIYVVVFGFLGNTCFVSFRGVASRLGRPRFDSAPCLFFLSLATFLRAATASVRSIWPPFPQPVSLSVQKEAGNASRVGFKSAHSKQRALYVRTYVCVCMYVRAYVCICVFMYVCMYACA
jgi:hypothetical protein